MDWRDEFVKPMNRITHDSQTLLGDFIALAGNWVYENAEEAAKFAAQIIDPTIVLFANNDIFVRTKLDDCEHDAAKKTPAPLMKTINFRYFTKLPNGHQRLSSVTLDRLMLSFSSMFHRYNRYVSRWDIDIEDKGTFSMCAPYRGRILLDENYNSAVLDRFLEFVLEVIILPPIAYYAIMTKKNINSFWIIASTASGSKMPRLELQLYSMVSIRDAEKVRL